jgi:hypothetical protein
MRTFKERFKYYIIGFGIGLIAVFFFFGERGCAWLPENRVKNTIAEKEIIYGDSIKDVMKCSDITTNDIYNLLNNNGDVDFSSSLPSQTPKVYVLTGDNNIIASIALYETYSELIEVKNGKSCESSINNSHKQLIPLPDDIARAIIESQALKYYDLAKCEMTCLGLTEKDIQEFPSTASINMEKSNAWPKLQLPNSGIPTEPKTYYMEGKMLGEKFDILYEIGENRTRVKHIVGPTECDC